jgi:hypothetical protein
VISKGLMDLTTERSCVLRWASRRNRDRAFNTFRHSLSQFHVSFVAFFLSGAVSRRFSFTPYWYGSAVSMSAWFTSYATRLHLVLKTLCTLLLV